MIDGLFVNENEYSYQMKTEVSPFLSDLRRDIMFCSEDGIMLHAETYINKGARCGVVISHGFTEYSRKYDEMIRFFFLLGCSVFICEHRGHGLSEREKGADGHVHITKFENYVSDLHRFITQYVLPCVSDMPLYLYAHSMGGAIGAEYLEDHPEILDRAVLSSPMIGINLHGFPRRAAKAVTYVFVRTGKGNKRVFFMKDKFGFDFSRSCSSSYARAKFFASLKASRPEYMLSAATYSWCGASLGAYSRITDRERCDKISVPVLVFSAENDRMVSASAEKLFVSRVKGAELITINGSRHEIYGSPDTVLCGYLEKISSFLQLA